MAGSDPHDLNRFVLAQAPAYDRALAELVAGEKRSHWMWFVFPQLRELGHSEMAKRYGIGSLDEARAFLRHPVLGSRLTKCTETVIRHEGRLLHTIFGPPDNMKFRSCMTLFALAAETEGSVFREALAKLCEGKADPKTEAILASDRGLRA